MFNTSSLLSFTIRAAMVNDSSSSSSSSSASADDVDMANIQARLSRKFRRGNMFCVCASFRQGVSSDEDADRPSESKARGMCGQFVWPCPREYPSELATRRDLKMLIPEDMSKQQVGEMFKKVVCQVGQLPNLDRLHIFDEPHKKYNPATGQRARHYHIIFRFKSTFAQKKVWTPKKDWSSNIFFS